MGREGGRQNSPPPLVGHGPGAVLTAEGESHLRNPRFPSPHVTINCHIRLTNSLRALTTFTPFNLV